MLCLQPFNVTLICTPKGKTVLIDITDYITGNGMDVPPKCTIVKAISRTAYRLEAIE